MIKRKKGIGAGTLAVIIIILVAFIILFTYTGASGSIFKKGGDIEICKLSVLAQAKTKTAGQTFVSLKCPRRQVKFFNNKVEINGKEEPKYKFKELDDKTVNKVIAEELRLCWYMMGEGTVDVFRQNIIQGENVCTICAEINFDNSVKQNEFRGLVEYLKTEKMPNSNDYYIDYLIKSQRNIYLELPLIGLLPWTQYGPWGYGTTNIKEIEHDKKKPSTTKFETSRDYAIYFLGFKPGIFNDKLGAFSSAYYIGLGEPEKAAEECKRLVN